MIGIVSLCSGSICFLTAATNAYFYLFLTHRWYSAVVAVAAVGAGIFALWSGLRHRRVAGHW